MGSATTPAPAPNWIEARRSLPNNAEVYEYTGYIDRRQGRWAEATANLRRALELDPRNFFTLQQMALIHHILHRYDEVGRTYERALAIVPNDPGIRIYRAYLEIDARADVKPFQETRAALVAEDPRVAADVDDPNYSLCERTPEAAARVLASFPREGSASMGALYPHAYWEGFIARWEGDARPRDGRFQPGARRGGKNPGKPARRGGHGEPARHD